jgi:hypothetical protein
VYKFNLYVMFVRKKSLYLRTCRNFKSAKSYVPPIGNPQCTNPQISKRLGSANRKSVKCQICERFANLFKLFNSANLRICDLQNFFADRPPLTRMKMGSKKTKIAAKKRSLLYLFLFPVRLYSPPVC